MARRRPELSRDDRTHYETLDISPSFPSGAIEGLRRSLSKIYHPDAGSAPDAKRMSQINAACDVLCDPRAREEYDRNLADEPAERERKHEPPPPPRPKPPQPRASTSPYQTFQRPKVSRRSSESPMNVIGKLIRTPGYLKTVAVVAFLWTGFWSLLFTNWHSPLIYIGWIVGAIAIAKDLNSRS